MEMRVFESKCMGLSFPESMVLEIRIPEGIAELEGQGEGEGEGEVGKEKMEKETEWKKES
jgi:hypothetical protein